MSSDTHLYSAGVWFYIFKRRWQDTDPQTIPSVDGCVFAEKYGFFSGVNWGSVFSSAGLIVGLHGCVWARMLGSAGPLGTRHPSPDTCRAHPSCPSL